MNRFKFESLTYLSTVLPFFLLIVMVSSATGGTGTGRLGDPCAVNNDCGEVLYCYGAPRVCRPSSVRPAHDGPPGPTGKEIPPCESDSDCPHGFRCSHSGGGPQGSCWAGNFPCKSSNDCAAGYHCTQRNAESFCDQDLSR
jgi:hypothetical protein